MRHHTVYDIPTRVFHWFFVLYFLTATLITKTVDEHDPTFSYHMMAGLVLSLLIILRIVWGIVGSSHARFSGFSLRPGDLISYLKGVLTGDKRRWAGHNPASSWAALIMLGLGAGLGLTGITMATGSEDEIIKEIHELLANTFIVVALAHVFGVALHTLRHKEWIGLSMIDGKKEDVPESERITSKHGAVGLLLVALVVAWVAYLNQNYDPNTQKLQILGKTLQLGEVEGEGEEYEGEDH